jgi:hypothetical protein
MAEIDLRGYSGSLLHDAPHKIIAARFGQA